MGKSEKLMKIKDIILCWDFIISILIGVIIYFICQDKIPGQIVKEVYGTGISVLSIVFSIFFAALAIIVSSSNDDFIKFFEAEGNYTALLNTFKYSIVVTFLVLVVSIALSSFTTFMISITQNYLQSKIILAIYSLSFLYSLFAVFNSTLDALKYAEYRVKYLKIKTRE